LKSIFQVDRFGAFPLENEGVSFLPDTPCTYHDHFHEERKWESLLSSRKLFKGVSASFQIIPKTNHLQFEEEQEKNKCSMVSSAPS